jgi:hypothetical protein
MRDTTPPSTTNNNNRTHACNRNRFSPFLLSRRRHHPIRISTTTQRLERTNERTNQDIFVSSSPGSRFVFFLFVFFSSIFRWWKTELTLIKILKMLENFPS